ncbi:hypothetical protein Pan216_04810 [Planctomycetes bacterium Pan216]|uniref:DUF481 domain-containing protein n=1 Tax=Kolteria novifilia TaxID=2527975 RepID=A0A518AY85_9BACT|nr:hypothetical protein Pan216_04810 [Planctomycetes bacterium Pan216]
MKLSLWLVLLFNGSPGMDPSGAPEAAAPRPANWEDVEIIEIDSLPMRGYLTPSPEGAAKPSQDTKTSPGASSADKSPSTDSSDSADSSAPKLGPPNKLQRLKRLRQFEYEVEVVARDAAEIVTVRASDVPPVLGTLLGPIRDANLLLPAPLDPFGENPIDANELPEREPEFSFQKQRQLLGTKLASRVDTDESKSVWNWEAEAGGSFRQGNVSSTNVQGAFRTNRRSKLGFFSASINGYFDKQQNADLNQRAVAQVTLDRNLRGRWVVYGKDDLEHDQAAQVIIRNVSSSGLGYRFIDRLEERLLVRTGPTLSQVVYTQEAETPNELRSGWLLEGEYRRLIGESARIEWSGTAFPDFNSEQAVRVNNDAAILFPIGGVTSHWKWKIGVNHRYQLDPVNDAKPSDVTAYFNILYAN